MLAVSLKQGAATAAGQNQPKSAKSEDTCAG